MNKSITKRLELGFKRTLKRVLLRFLPPLQKGAPKPAAIRKVLVFRLDQRIGNGILLLPLLRAIRTSLPGAEIHLLIHHPVAGLFRESAARWVDRIWPYHQSYLMRWPLRYLRLFRRLRRERFDLVITSHNPDNFSLSQALAGRLMKPGWLVGFDAKDSARFYDVAVASGTEKHYADVMIDLLRIVAPQAVCEIGGLEISPEAKKALGERFPEFAEGGILVWLGATGKKVLPAGVFAFLYEQLREHSDLPVHFAAGTADAGLLHAYPDWIRERTVIWQESLPETAAFFAHFALFVSGDTGPMHLAAALGLPTLTIFIDSNLAQYGYHDEKKHFALQWQDTPECRQGINRAIARLLA